ncbi:hypothetical protein Despr_2898 [Desulfobulbus propionicus DSM 2032]|jgi:hypothetical protein|uniref:Uncharacterized protein n=1 Tax=Desulfobulbus propionicus (strain ATCC 33891 / DSM 2032 / VKM B-1956 / 1pr3) TaxID=577650 RepID=A0A7U4DQB9_DESPD|nr:hypothetical protein Despr_2898 [Desulfobulbus propionicus DSM 2032]
MKELLLIGVALAAGLVTLAVLVRRSGGDCIP